MSTSDTTAVVHAILGRLNLDPDTSSDTTVTQEAGKLWATISNMSSTGESVLYPINAIFNLLRRLTAPTFQDLMEVIDAHVEGYAAAKPFISFAIDALTTRQTGQPTQERTLAP